MIYMDRNKCESKDFLSFAREKGADCGRIRPYQNTSNAVSFLGGLNPEKNNKLKPCIHLWKRMHISWDGRAVLCCNDYNAMEIVGDVKKNSLREIWNNEQYLRARRLHASGEQEKIPLCKYCSILQISPMLLLGSAFLGPVSLRKCLYVLEKMLISGGVDLIRYS
jgi:radical SAM protein with 4Fe4S-binding SPASM domain